MFPHRKIKFPAIAMAGALAHWVPAASAQEIENPGFEFPSLSGKPFVGAPSEDLHGSGWGWGHFTGICRQNTGPAKNVPGYEGSQMAFLRGDPRHSKLDKNAPRHMFGGVITGLTPGEQYELQWAETGRDTDEAYGALTVILRERPPIEGKKPILLQRSEPVTGKGEWAVKKHIFTATSPEMSVNFAHNVPNYGQPGVTGDETTFIDAIEVNPGPKKNAE